MGWLPMALIQRESSDPGLHLRCLHVLGSSSTGDDFDQFASNDGLSGSVEQNLVPVDHISGVLGSILRDLSAYRYSRELGKVKLTSMAFRRAEISQAWPSARAQ